MKVRRKRRQAEMVKNRNSLKGIKKCGACEKTHELYARKHIHILFQGEIEAIALHFTFMK